MLAHLFPGDAQLFAAKADEAARSRLLAGVQYPSDVTAGLALGRVVAALVIERAKTDGSDAVWTGTVPAGPGKWNGTNPILPLAGTWRTWVLSSGGTRNYWFWNEQLTKRILEYRLDANPPRTARAYAIESVAIYDAGVACWDAEYTYWQIRPFQLDPNWPPLFPTPNHPSYPCGSRMFLVRGGSRHRLPLPA